MAHNIVWFEVMGQDADKMRSFYGELFGWTFNPLPGMDYALTDCEETGVPGGIGSLPSGKGWNTFYVSVDDLDEKVVAATSGGGDVLLPATTLPDGGRVAVVSDAAGRALGLFQQAPWA